MSVEVATGRWGWATVREETVPYQWHPPVGVNSRGTVVLLPGRGEYAGVYRRFGTRLAADGYQVVSADGLIAGATGDAESALVRALGELEGPVVLVGSDTGAYLALRLAASASVAGVVAAGSTDGAAAPTTEWADELDARTACPTHRALLGEDEHLVRGALRNTTPIEIRPGAVRAPVLVIHGERDVVADQRAARALARQLPRAELAVVRDGRHDVLNDLNHRTVAAEIVQFLERVRSGGDAAPILLRAAEKE
jgi:alpha-beta hydrolase superfamily lysophospholipase